MNHERVVIDTNVFISALLNPNGTPRQVVNLVIEQFSLLHSEATYQELETRLNKPKFNKYISETDKLDFVAMLQGVSIMVTVKHSTTICSDKDDNKFLELAITGQAKYLITGDNDLLILQEYQGVQIITPSAFLEMNR